MTAAESTVLLVEDNATDVLLIRRAFDKARLGNPLHVLGDGDAAVEYLSGSARYADREQFPLPAYDSGVNSYLVKPVEFDALFDMLKAVSLYWVMFNTKPHLGNGER